MKIEFVPKKFTEENRAWIRQADRFANDYAERGFNLSLRQLYYQFVAAALIENNESNYNKLGRLVSQGRLAGLIDWNHLEDRGRDSHDTNWHTKKDPTVASTMRRAKGLHNFDLWQGQPRRVEIWVEKQALEEVASIAAKPFRMGYFACKGYVSQSEMFVAGTRMERHMLHDQPPLILHLGDHDPSGLDMTRDIQERLSLFANYEIEVKRIALNMDQIEQYNPPPNFAKETDTRHREYVRKYDTTDSWELDSITPELLVELIQKEISEYIDIDLFNARVAEEHAGEAELDLAAEWWPKLKHYVSVGED